MSLLTSFVKFREESSNDIGITSVPDNGISVFSQLSEVTIKTIKDVYGDNTDFYTHESGQTDHPVNKAIYHCCTHYVKSRLRPGQIVLDVGSSLKSMLVNGIIPLTPYLEEGDIARGEFRKYTMHNSRNITDITTMDVNFLDVKVKADVVILNHVYDIDFAELFLKCREIGVSKVIFICNITSTLLSRGVTIMPLSQQKIKLESGRLIGEMFHSGRNYNNNFTNYIAPIVYDKIILPNNDGMYVGELIRSVDASKIIEFNYTTERINSSNSGILVSPALYEDYYVARKIEWDLFTVTLTYDVLPREIYSKIASMIDTQTITKNTLSSIRAGLSTLAAPVPSFEEANKDWASNLDDMIDTLMKVASYSKQDDHVPNMLDIIKLVLYPSMTKIVKTVFNQIIFFKTETVTIRQRTLDMSKVKLILPNS
ncbi:hypothetical protein CANARDRAFT_54445 [[Candida] arabinofermentans NRRL YB-2248]|uniref:Alphavirus-like MT domain-containing protein n=1 Tax=[Candida] arabinofermentans NRRL YB-2248 TaxID=983967 RepID=A0A1E4T8C4_9ASCO|nr:hypothetical protein CANARDRAFT_54445 [[Candida] arabinofermentans NRRL YB-2248]